MGSVLELCFEKWGGVKINLMFVCGNVVMLAERWLTYLGSVGGGF